MANDNQSHVFAIAQAWFLICITIALFTPSVDPRDRSLFSGDLSRPFRQCLFAVTCTLTLRCFAFEDRRFSAGSGSGGVGNFYYFWVGMESVLFCFLKLCTPFLLQRYLATKINIVPGKDLQGWLYAILLLDCTAIFLTTNVAPQFWALKRAGDAVVFFPLIQNLRLYRRIESNRSSGGDLASSPFSSFALLDILIGIEYCRFVSVLGATVSYALDSHDPAAPQLHEIWIAVRLASIFVGYLAVLLHGLFLVAIDEQQFQLHEYRRRAATAASDPMATNTVEEVEGDRSEEPYLSVSLVARGR